MKKTYGFRVMFALAYISAAFIGAALIGAVFTGCGDELGVNGVPGSPPNPPASDPLAPYMTLYIQSGGGGNGESLETPLATIDAVLDKVADAYGDDPDWPVTNGTTHSAEIIVLDTITLDSASTIDGSGGPPIILRYVPKAEQDEAEAAGSPIERAYPLIKVTGSGVELTLRNIILKGVSGNTSALILVRGGAKLVLETGTVITGNKSSGQGGGVLVKDSGSTLDMTGGTINGNTAPLGGGVVIVDGTFNMSGGTICGNTAALYDGGGVSVGSYGTTFNMSGTAEISGNTTGRSGGGVSVGTDNCIFNMSGGTIRGNTAAASGGGVVVYFEEENTCGRFTKTGGIIYGYDPEDSANSNKVVSGENIVQNQGHAVLDNTNKRDSTAEETDTTADDSFWE